MANIKGKQLASNLSVTNVTASGHISGSNTSTGSFGALNVSGKGTFGSQITTGDILVSQYIKHDGDANTFINFTDDRIQFEAGSIVFLGLHKKGSAPHQVTVNNGGNHIDFVVKDNDGDILFRTDADADNVLFPEATKISGSSVSTGSFGRLELAGDISSSSGSFGNVEISNNATIDGDLIVTENIKHKGDVNTLIRFTDNKIKLEAGGMSFVSLHDDDSAPFPATINPNSERINFKVLAKNGQLLLKTDSDVGNVILYYSGSEKLSTNNDGIDVTGNVSGSSISTGSFGKVVVGEMGNQDVTSVSSSISTRLTTAESELSNTLISSSAQIASNISGSFTAASSSFSTRVTTAESELSNTLISSSAQIASDISGSLSTTSLNALGLTLVSSSAQIASNISGSFTTPSASFSTRITTAETELGNTLFSSSAQVDHDSTTNFVANEHIDHSGVTITAGAGLTGGGTIAATRTLAVGQGTGVTVNANDVAIGQDVATTANVTFASINTTGNIEAEGDVIAQNYIVSSSVTHMTSSFRSGSTISGDTPADDTHQFTGSLFISGSAPTDITTTNSIFVGNDITGSVISGSSLLGVVGTATQGTINHDSLAGFVANEHIDHSGVTLTAGDGLSGGGDITTNRSFAVEAAQTTITSIINSSLGKIGTAADQEYITFGTSNEVNTFVNNSERLSVTSTGANVSGDFDVSATGSFGHISSTGVIRTTSIISGSTLEATGDLTLDASGDIILDADGTDIILKDGGTSFGSFKRASSDFIIKAETADKDILFKGTDDSSTITALQLDMSEGGNAQFLGNISGSQIEASGDVIAFGSSDRRLKDNITPISEPLNKLSKVGGYTFIWNDKQDAYKGKDVGVIAQEIEEILPEVVTTRGTGYKAVKYEKIVPLLIESIKELQKKVEDIEKNCDCLNK